MFEFIVKFIVESGFTLTMVAASPPVFWAGFLFFLEG
jgi:hypothetical protein